MNPPRFILLLLVALWVIGGTGCSLFSAFTPAEICKHPGAPMLILEVKGEYARVAVYIKSLNTLMLYGWVETKTFEGRTVAIYDWERFIKSRIDANTETPLKRSD